MQQTDIIFHLQQQYAATSMSDLHESLSTLPEQLLIQPNPVSKGKALRRGHLMCATE